MPKHEDPVIRFWRKVGKTEGCWLWTGSRSPYYGNFYPDHGTCVHAHRYSWELAYGPIPPDMQVLHKCDVRHCVRPDHLFLGTQQDNMDDMAAKGRRWTMPRKLSPAQEQEIVTRFVNGTMSQRALAAEYGVSQALVSKILLSALPQPLPMRRATKLTVAQVQAIRAAYAAGARQTDLAQQYGTDSGTMSRIVHNKAWRDDALHKARTAQWAAEHATRRAAGQEGRAA